MPFPVAVSPAANLGNGAPSQNGYGFEHGGVKYLVTFGAESDPGTIGNWHVQYSTDGGNTWIDIIGPARPFTLGTLNQAFPCPYTVGIDGDTAIVASINAVNQQSSPTNWSNFTISFFTVDLTVTPPVVSSLSTSAQVNFIGLMDFASQAANHSNRTSIQIAVRGPSDYILFVSGVCSGSGTTQKAKASYVTWDGSISGFGGEVQLPAQDASRVYMPVGICYASVSQRTHFLYTDQAFNGAPSILHVAMDFAGVFGTPATVIDSTVLAGSLFFLGANSGPQSCSAPIIYNTPTEHIGFLAGINDGSFNNDVTFFSATEALQPTFSTSTITTDQTVAPTSQLILLLSQMYSVVSNGNSILASWVFWDGSTSPANSAFYYSKSDIQPLSWSVPVNLIPVTPGATDLVANQVVSFPITEGYGVFGVATSEPFNSPLYDSEFAIVEDATTPLAISGEPPDGVVGILYIPFSFTATGGTPSYTFSSPDTEDLPPGLTLSSAGVLSGTPTQTGTFTFTVTVTDSLGNTASETVSVVITGFAILLYGWKLYPEQPCGEPEEIDECPHVERAM